MTDSPAAPTEATKPNIVLIVTDQHRRDHVGWIDDRFVTPNLDRLAADGVVFDQAIVANPICMPNRATLATGRLPSVHGTRFNGVALDRRARTFMHALGDAGYETALVGKLHLENMGDHPEIVEQVVDQRLQHDALAIDPDGAGWEMKARYDDDALDHDIPSGWFGFDRAELAIDHGDTVGGHYALWLRDHGIDPTSVRGAANALDVDPSWSEIRTPAVGVEHYHSTWVGERAAAAIRTADVDRPFFLQVSFPDPHHPFTPPGDWPRRRQPAELDPPRTFDNPHTNSMPHMRRMAARRGVQRFHLAAFSPSLQQYQRALAAEITTIELIDRAIGQVLSALEETGRLDDTIVIFTSDHGDMFGDHGLMLKVAMHYRAVREVPLVVAGSGVGKGSVPSLVSTLDLAQTICGLAGAEPYWGMQGHDLTPLVRNPNGPSVRDAVLIEEDQMFDLAGSGQPLRMRTLVTDEARLTRYAGLEEGELYDLQADRDECDNVHGQASGRSLRTEMTERLADALVDSAARDVRPRHMA